MATGDKHYILVDEYVKEIDPENGVFLIEEGNRSGLVRYGSYSTITVAVVVEGIDWVLYRARVDASLPEEKKKEICGRWGDKVYNWKPYVEARPAAYADIKSYNPKLGYRE